jgi:thiol-disulfide isomerase/thioredoxin
MSRNAMSVKTGWVVVSLLLIGSAMPANEPLRPFVKGSWQELRNASARPTIVHFWGVTCAPCMAELPQWGQLVRSRPDVRIVFVSADPVQVDRSVITTAITKAGIGSAENWLLADAFPDPIRYEVNPQWIGELPYTAMVGRDGRTSFVKGAMDTADVVRWLDGRGEVGK